MPLDSSHQCARADKELTGVANLGARLAWPLSGPQAGCSHSHECRWMVDANAKVLVPFTKLHSLQFINSMIKFATKQIANHWPFPYTVHAMVASRVRKGNQGFAQRLLPSHALSALPYGTRATREAGSCASEYAVLLCLCPLLLLHP